MAYFSTTTRRWCVTRPSGGRSGQAWRGAWTHASSGDTRRHGQAWRQADGDRFRLAGRAKPRVAQTAARGVWQKSLGRARRRALLVPTPLLPGERIIAVRVLDTYFLANLTKGIHHAEQAQGLDLTRHCVRCVDFSHSSQGPGARGSGDPHRDGAPDSGSGLRWRRPPAMLT